jgi:hypothetical protein
VSEKKQEQVHRSFRQLHQEQEQETVPEQKQEQETELVTDQNQEQDQGDGVGVTAGLADEEADLEDEADKADDEVEVVAAGADACSPAES